MLECWHMKPSLLHLLIVDDSLEDRSTIRRLLPDNPPIATITEADQGALALALGQATPPDCILLDYRLPDMASMEVLARIRMLSAVPVVLLATAPDEALAADACQRGFQDYLVKGMITPERLRLTIERAVAAVQLARERDRARALLATMRDTLYASDARYQTLFETMAQGVVYQAADGQIVACNPAAEQILGMTLAQMRGHTSLDPRWRAIHLDGAPFPGETHPAMVALRTGQVVRHVVMGVYDWAHNTYRWININAMPQFRPGESEPIQVYTTFDDITEHVQAEQSAAEALSRLDALITSLPSGIGYLDRDLRYQLVNPALAAINDRTPTDHLGRTLAEVLPGLAPRLEPIIRQVLATGVAARNLELRGRPCPLDGVAHDWLISYFPVREPTGEVIGIGVSVADLTQHKHTEVALRETERKLGMLFAILPVGISIFDATGAIVYVNPALEQITRMNRGDLFRKAYVARQYVRPDGTPMPSEEFVSVRVIREQQMVSDVEMGIVTETGERIWTSVSAVPVDFPDWRVVVVTTDITARKRIAEELQAALAAERVALLVAEAASMRMAHLQTITAALAGAITQDRILAVMTGHRNATIGTPHIAVALLAPGEQQLRYVTWRGCSGEALAALPPLDLHSLQPMSATVRDQVPVWLRSRDEAEARFPGFGAIMAHDDCHAHATLPLMIADQVVGGISFSYAVPHAFAPEQQAYMVAIVQPCGLALERVRLYDETFAAHGRLQQLSRQLLVAQEQERRHIARELHDEVGQSLGALKINLHMLGTRSGTSADTARLAESLRIVDLLIQQVRALSLDLHPAILDDLGLVAALAWYCDRFQQRTGLALAFADRIGVAPVSPLVATACFRIAQEALTNVVRHAHAQRVTVTLSRQEGMFALSVCDDGIGFDVQDQRAKAVAGASLGLISITERAELARGWVDISSSPGDGAEVWVWFPLDGAESVAN